MTAGPGRPPLRPRPPRRGRAPGRARHRPHPGDVRPGRRDRGPWLLAPAVPPPARPPRAPGRPQHRGLPALVLRALDGQPAGRRGGRRGVRPRLLGPGGVRAGFDDYRATFPRSGPTRSPGSCWPSSGPDPLLLGGHDTTAGPPVGGPGGPAASRCYPALKATPPNWSKASATPGTPGLFWVNSWPPVAVSPPAEPGITLTAPARPRLPTLSQGAPAAGSANPSLSKSPPAFEPLSAAADGALCANAGLAPAARPRAGTTGRAMLIVASPSSP
jgi:hypothetical protein